MKTDNDNVTNNAASRTARERFRRLAEAYPVHRTLPRSTLVVAATIAIALSILIISGIALGVPAGEILKSYTDRLWELMF